MTLLEHHTAMTLQVAVTFRIATAEDLPRLEWYWPVETSGLP